MFERIVLAVDGSAESQKAIPVVAGLAQLCHAEVTVVHVREHQATWSVDVDLEAPSEAVDLVDDVVRQLNDSGIEAGADVRRSASGLAPREILDAATDARADLIVVGSRGLTDWKGLLLGSVAHKVIQHAPCPVLVVR